MSTDMRIGASPAVEHATASSPAPKAQPQSDRSVGWALLWALCGFGAALALEEFKPVGSGARYQAGQLLVLSAFMSAATFMFFRHMRLVSCWPKIFITLCIPAWFMASFVGQEYYKHQSQVALKDVNEALDLAIKAAASSGPVDTSALTRLSKSTGSAATLEMLIKSSFKHALDLQTEYQLALKKSGIERLLDGQRIQQDKSMAETRAIAAEARQVVQVYRQRNLALFETVRQQLELAPLDDATRRKASAAMLGVMQQNIEASTRSWDLSQEMVEVFARTAEMLGASRTRWRFKDGEFTFSKKSDVDEFTRNASALQKLEAEQQALQDGLLRQARAKLRSVP